jgi:hypothetical protein
MSRNLHPDTYLALALLIVVTGTLVGMVLFGTFHHVTGAGL